jgi:hypothetical protein
MMFPLQPLAPAYGTLTSYHDLQFHPPRAYAVTAHMATHVSDMLHRKADNSEGHVTNVI